MRYRKSCVTGAGSETLLVVGTGPATSWWQKSTEFVSLESSPISAWASDGPEPAPGTEPSSAPGTVRGPEDAAGTAVESAGAPGVSAPAGWIIPVNVMAPTMQVACKTFIAPNSAARSPKERYTHVPRSPRRHARCFLVDCPTRGDGQDWDGSHLPELLLMRHAYRRSRRPRLLASTSRPRCSHSWMKSSSNTLRRLWVIRVSIKFDGFRVPN